MDDLTRAEVEVERPEIDRGGVFAVVVWAVGVRSEVDGCVERRQGEVVAVGHVEEDLTRRRRVAGPDLQRRGDRRSDVVNHDSAIKVSGSVGSGRPIEHTAVLRNVEIGGGKAFESSPRRGRGEFTAEAFGDGRVEFAQFGVV